MKWNMKKAIKAIFENEKIIVITQNDEKLGGKLICLSDGKFAIKRMDGRIQPIWVSAMRFIGLDGFDVLDCKGADGSSSILLENGLCDETEKAFDILPDSINPSLIKEINALRTNNKYLRGRNIELKADNEKWYAEFRKEEAKANKYYKWYTHERIDKEKLINKDKLPERSETFTFRAGDPHDIENIAAATIFNRGRSGPDRLYRRDPFEEFAIIQQKSGAVGLLADFYTVFRVA